MKDLDNPTVCPVHLQLFRPSVIRGPWTVIWLIYLNSYYDDEDDEAIIDCSEYGKAYQFRTDLENKKCSEFAIDGFQCVPFYACKAGEVITSGASILSTRSVSGTLDQLFDPLDSKCDDLQEICCRMPDWKDVPLEKQSEIPLPEKIPNKCLAELKEG